jgi:hypothetical protein
MPIRESLDGVQHVYLHGENGEDLEEARKMLIFAGMQEEWEVRRQDSWGPSVFTCLRGTDLSVIKDDCLVFLDLR